VLPYYFDAKNFLRQQQTDMTVNTKQAIEGNFGPELLEFMHDYVQEKIEKDFGMQKACIPSPDVPAHCEIFMSSDFATRKHLLVLVACKRDTPPGIWSRGLCLSHGLDVGSMLPVIKKAIEAGYGVVVLNPKKNSVEEPGVFAEDTTGQEGEVAAAAPKVKLMIEGSKSGEEHILTVWDKYLAPSQATNISFLTCTEGADLVNHLVRERPAIMTGTSRIGGCAFVEPGKMYVKSKDGAMETFMEKHAIVLEQPSKHEAQLDTTGDGSIDTLQYTLHLTGAPETALTLALPSVDYNEIPQATKDSAHASNVALGMVVSLPHVMEFFAMAKADADGSGAAQPLSNRFITALATQMDLPPPMTIAAAEEAALPHPAPHQSRNPFKKFFKNLGFFNDHTHHDETERPPAKEDSPPAAAAGAGGGAGAGEGESPAPAVSEPLGPDDFELLQVVGKGGFGKVFLVRRKHDGKPLAEEDDNVYAMKVLTKSQIFRDKQVLVIVVLVWRWCVRRCGWCDVRWQWWRQR
jgi:serum/glucocorticoid-regulated kinase 2